MAEASTSGKHGKSENSNDDGNSVILYHYYTSYFSQKVVFALFEKKLKFKSHIVNILCGEQFEPWFMKLNAKAEVPVLKDGVKVIPDSDRIIDYLEDNFSNGDTPRLIPDKGSQQYQTMEHLRDLLNKVQIELITFGCFLHPEFTKNIKMSPHELKIRTNRYPSQIALLDELTDKHKEFCDHYLTKRSKLEKHYALVQNVSEVKKALDELDVILGEVESELASHDKDKEKWWLCGEKFTIADIILSVLINRIQVIGLWERFFGNFKHEHIHNYFKRVQQRESFRKTMKQNAGLLGTLCCLGTKEKLLVSVGGVIALVGVAGLAAFLLQRKK